MARILLHTLVFRPDGVSTAIIVSGIARGLQEAGHKVAVLTTTPHYNRDTTTEGQQPLTPKMWGMYHESNYHGIRVIHIPMPRRSQKIGGRILDYLRFHFWCLVLGLLLFPRQDIVLSPSPPLSIGVVGKLLAMLKGAKAIYNVQEIYPMVAVQVGLLDPESRSYRFFERLAHLVYRLSDHIVVITRSFKQDIEAEGVPPGKISVIPNYGVLEYDPHHQKDNPLSREYGLAEKTVFAYAGNIGMSHSFETIIEVVQRVADIPDLHFLIVGGGVRHNYVEEQIREHGLKNITLLEYQPTERMPDIYGTADVALVPLTAGTAKSTIPSKIYTIMANGVAVLLSVDTDSDIVAMVEEANCGVAVPPDNADAMEQAVRQLMQQPDVLATYGKNGQDYVGKHYSQETVVQQYARLIDKLC